jgi:ATP-dependent RNA helicase DDX42
LTTFPLTVAFLLWAAAGSGKTLAYILPMMVHIMDQPELQEVKAVPVMKALFHRVFRPSFFLNSFSFFFPHSHQGDGPIAIVLAPTRELVQQIGREVKSYATQYGMQVAAIYGGGSRYEQSKVLKAGCEVIVATPGRLLDFLKDKVC